MVADDQVRLVDVLVREQNNLTDVLRHALAVGDREVVARLVALLGSLWTITGDQPRIFAVCDAASELLTGWDGARGLHRHAQEAAGVLMVHLSWMPGVDLGGLRALLLQGAPPVRHLGADRHTRCTSPTSRPTPPTGSPGSPPAQPSPARPGCCCSGRRSSPRTPETWRRPVGTPSRRCPRPLPPYLLASLHAELSQLAMAVGDHHRAAHHAEIAWPLLLRVHSQTDAYSLQVATAIAPLLDGDIDTARALLEEFGPPDGESAQMGARLVWQTAHAEVALARGDHPEALRRYDAIVDMALEGEPGAGITPWLMLAASAALVAERGTARRCRTRAPTSCATSCWGTASDPRGLAVVHRPAAQRRTDGGAGRLVAAVRPADQHEDAVRLLAIAHRWAYNRSIPVMAWEPMVALAETARAGAGRPARRGAGRPPRSRPAAGGGGGRGAAATLLGHIFLKRRTESGAKIATTTAQPSSAQPTAPVTWPWLARSRRAVMTSDTGLTSAKASSGRGIVSVGTNALDRNVSGNITSKEMPWTP